MSNSNSNNSNGNTNCKTKTLYEGKVKTGEGAAQDSSIARALLKVSLDNADTVIEGAPRSRVRDLGSYHFLLDLSARRQIT